jgi:hypothetical protein
MHQRLLLRCFTSCASTHKTTGSWTTAALATPSELLDLPTTVVHGRHSPAAQMATKAPESSCPADRPRLVSGLGPIATCRPGPNFGFSLPCGLAAFTQGHGHVASALLCRGAARAPTQPTVGGSPSGLVRTITTKQWRRLKIKKHKIKKRRRLNRKAAK